jgi:hypothetical protein
MAINTYLDTSFLKTFQEFLDHGVIAAIDIWIAFGAEDGDFYLGR